MRLSEAFAAREIRKEYLALVQGVPAPAGTVDAPLGRHPTVKVKVAVAKNGKEARSEWRVLHKGQGYSLLGVRIFTGRTHQIRVHMAHVGHPLWGDKLYGRGGQVLTPPSPARCSSMIRLRVRCCTHGICRSSTRLRVRRWPSPARLRRILSRRR